MTERFRSAHDEVAAKMMRTSEAPHQAQSEKRDPKQIRAWGPYSRCLKLRLIGPDGGVSGDGEPSGPPNARQI